MRLLLILASLMVGPALRAELRTFTDDGGRQIQAELVGMNGDHVVLKRNGKMAKWPLAKLSQDDQVYVKGWIKSAPKETPEIQVRIWERDGIGSSGSLNADKLENTLGKNIPGIKQTEEKGYYKHYDIDLTNRAPIDASDLIVSYVLYVVDAKNQVVGENGTEEISDIPSNERKTVTSKGITYVRTKTKTATLGTNILGHLQIGSSTDRTKEKFGGAWVRVYSPDGKMVGESKDLSDELEKLDIPWTGATGENAISIPDSFSKLEELFGPLKEAIEQIHEKLPKPPGNLPKPPGGPRSGPPKLPFGPR